MQIVADNTIPYLQGVIEPLGEVNYLPAGQFTAEAVREADLLIVRSIDKCTREVLEGSRVKLITTATIGFDHIDTAYCDQAGIVWRNAPGSNARSVAQYLLASIVALSVRNDIPLKGKTIGIIGVGHVGSEVERLCRAFGMQVLRNDPPRAEREGNEGFVSLETIAHEADIITLHTPLTRQGNHPTYHLANRAFFDQLRRKPLFINAARGAVHDTQALLDAYRQGTISRMIIDCWENEPNISYELLQAADIATPHIAGFSADGKANATRMCLEHISQFFRVEIEEIGRVTPPPPSSPIIDLKKCDHHPVEQAILTAFDPVAVDQKLREAPTRFEWYRTNYHYPREFEAYRVTGNSEAQELLQRLGFCVE
ncbi:4-phosphoerythronate dehydrogenase PdxB [Parabacteroides sp. OttesenSCG-928-N08]|nr:4-phosphoerythronate dehydrogenase PdxB [Parabacteroides sp. OttesenSCG-928-N08]